MASEGQSLFSFSTIAGEKNQETNIKVRPVESLDNEFRYYSELVQDLVAMLSRSSDKEAVPKWVAKLSTPAYNVPKLRDKRNRYMLMLCMSLIMDTIDGPFRVAPPINVLPDLITIERPPFIQYDWERDTMWEEELERFNEIETSGVSEKIKSTCPVHNRYCSRDTKLNKKIAQTLDKQFRFFLYISRPYAAMLSRSSDRLRAAKWIQALCIIDKNACAIWKGIRNDYMMALIGYLSNQNLVGPFQDFPVEKLIPICEIAKVHAEKKPITDPTHPRTSEFFLDVPHPVEGAFALITITGDLYEAKF